jgi:hypothetical protein
MNPAGSNLKDPTMKTRLEQMLNLIGAVVTLAAAFGLDPMIAALASAAIGVGLAVSAGLPR